MLAWLYKCGYLKTLLLNIPSYVLVRVSKENEQKMIINHPLGDFWRIEPYPDLDTR